jgi:hypothetical protein
MRKALSIAFGAIVGSIHFAATTVPITAFTLISPSPSITGPISLKTCFTAGSRTSRASRSRPSSPRSQGSGSSSWITVPATIEPA